MGHHEEFRLLREQNEARLAAARSLVDEVLATLQKLEERGAAVVAHLEAINAQHAQAQAEDPPDIATVLAYPCDPTAYLGR